MDSAELILYKQRLLAMRVPVRADSGGIAGAAMWPASRESQGGFVPAADAATRCELDGETEDAPWWAIENELRTLNRIERALERIEDGRFGLCEECQRAIAKDRLTAIPYIERCADCEPDDDNR